MGAEPDTSLYEGALDGAFHSLDPVVQAMHAPNLREASGTAIVERAVGLRPALAALILGLPKSDTMPVTVTFDRDSDDEADKSAKRGDNG